MIRNRLDRLEERARTMLNDKEFVEVMFSDGSRRTMRLADVIPFLQEGHGPEVIDVKCEDGPLAKLIRGLLWEDDAE